MLFDFALEPELVSTWHDRKEFLFFDEKFGIKTRRIISAYPENWSQKVWQAFRDGDYWQDQNAKMRLGALMDHMKSYMGTRQDSSWEIESWLERTIAEHQKKPFHGIISKRNPTENDKVIEVSTLIEEGHESWNIPEDILVKRDAGKFTNAVAPILKLCSQFVFIDPYFNPEKVRFNEPLDEFLNIIWNQRCVMGAPKIELHISIDTHFQPYEKWSNRNPTEERKVCKHLIRSMQAELPKIIPKGGSVFVTIWSQIEHGEKLHNRYILTDICLLLFPTGLDQANTSQDNETDDLTLLSSKQRDKRWQHYKGSPPAFNCLVDSLEVFGNKNI